MIEIGQTVGNYAVQAKLGEGGMGTVFLVEHPVIGRKAALKAIHPEFSRNLEVVSRFITEAKAINQVGHDHIVDVTDFGNTPAGDFYFIMEYLDGRSVADCISNDGRFSPRRALHVAAQIADALQASHDHGVIHRDLKPDNIFLVRHGDDPDFVKVLDFGLAKLFGTSQRRPMHNTKSGSIFGTPCYMAPEQCEGKVEVDHRADVYSLGVILFEMLTGKVPFGGTGFGEIIVKHMTVPAPAARSLVPDLPPALDAILSHALAKDPAHRFQSMAELREALLDPDAFAPSLPARGREEDLSGRFRAAGPMARREISLRPPPPPPPDSGQAPALARSTFSGSTGQVQLLNVAAVPRTRYGRKVAVAAAVVAAVVVIKTAAYRRPVAGMVAAAQSLTRPATVRLNFGSDPDGATIVRSDGSVLGTTPLSTEVPYADAPTEFVVRKPGYVSKTVSLVPNLPSPVFAVLQAMEPPAPPPVVSAVSDVAPTAPATAPRAARRPHPRRQAAVTPTFRPASVQDDEILPPSVY